MASRDLHNNLHFVPLFVPKAAVTDNTAQVSAIIDTKGYMAAELAWVVGNNADADVTHTVLVEHGDDAALADAAAVPDAQLLGTEVQAAWNFADDGECRKIGYVGSRRYLRVTITPVNNTGNVFIGGMAVLGHPYNHPTPTLA